MGGHVSLKWLHLNFEGKQRRHDISIIGQWPHYAEKQSISHVDLLDLPYCALGKTINVKQLCSSPSPHK